MDSRIYWIWLQQTLGAGSSWAEPLLTAFHTPEGVYAAPPEELAKRVPGTVCRRLKDRSLEGAKEILRRTVAEGDWLITPADEAYPALLRGIHSPPLVLYGRGTMPDFSTHPSLAVVGTRRLTAYGRRVTDLLVRELTAGGALIVTGVAEGGDAAAIRAALEAGGTPVALLPCGLDLSYPLATLPLRRQIPEAGGALLTEYPYGVRVGKGAFHARNRLISGLALGVCVTEAPLGSGALITASCAKEQGRDVYAVPGDLTSPASAGTNELIKAGARLLVSAGEVLAEYGHLFPSEERKAGSLAAQPKPLISAREADAAVLPQTLSDGARARYRQLETEPCPVDDIAARVGLTVSGALALLTELELYSLVSCTAGQQYYRV